MIASIASESALKVSVAGGLSGPPPLPHVHRHDLDRRELLWRQRIEMLAETCGRAALREMLDGAAINVADDRYLVLSATKRLLAQTDPFERSGWLESLSPRDCAFPFFPFSHPH